VSRELTSGFINETLAAVSRPILLFEGEFNAQWVRLWNGMSDLTYTQDGQSVTYYGNGWMQSISGGEDKAEMVNSTISIGLSGVPEDLISMMLSAKQNAKGNFRIGFLNTSGAVIADPYLFFSGRLDTVSIYESPEAPTVTINYSSALNDTERARNYKYTQETQMLFYPSDKGFEFVQNIADQRTIFWGPQPKKVK
jgi:hypothetical protein